MMVYMVPIMTKTAKRATATLNEGLLFLRPELKRGVEVTVAVAVGKSVAVAKKLR